MRLLLPRVLSSHVLGNFPLKNLKLPPQEFLPKSVITTWILKLKCNANYLTGICYLLSEVLIFVDKCANSPKSPNLHGFNKLHRACDNWTATTHHFRFCSARHVATELTRPKSGGVCHLVCHSATCVWDRSSWHRWAATASTACVVQLGAAAVADWWCNWPMPNTLCVLVFVREADILNILCDYHLFSLYLMNFRPMFHTVLDAAGDVLRVQKSSSGGRESKAGIRPGRHLKGRKYGIQKFGRFWQIAICIADSDILHPVIPLRLPRFETTSPTVSSPRPHTKQCVRQHTYTGDLTEHSPAVKLQKIHIVQLLFYWQSQFSVLHYSRVSKFCIKFENYVWNLITWFSGNL